MEVNLTNIQTIQFKGVEYSSLYARGRKVWPAESEAVTLSSANNIPPLKRYGEIVEWTVKDVKPNDFYFVGLTNISKGSLKASQVKMGDSELRSAKVSGGVITTNVNPKNSNGIVYIRVEGVPSSDTPLLRMY
ncbi:hypothetical protein QNJ24_00260 [Macrococcus caseolyticus]|uniref:hypothetical protein n=1 Tax=Macrococcoides caseolyticum TaxID=69966 RepID=UPI0024BBF015|nr:hypothetical protein [Macrococcus caseolyticus]MDJ1154514.1 hypothetical protein [Macrococcus caseolyticus]